MQSFDGIYFLVQGTIMAVDVDRDLDAAEGVGPY